MIDVQLRVVDKQSRVVSGKTTVEGVVAMVTGADDAKQSWDAVLATYTDRVDWTTANDLDLGHTDKLLELRAYNRAAELHTLRSSLTDEFVWRIVDDDNTCDKCTSYGAHFDEMQYLDIDTPHSYGTNYLSTGGGAYQLPLENAERVIVRNYIKFDESDGMASIVDFRIVRLVAEGEHNE